VNLGSGDVYSVAVLNARVSVLDIVETYQSIDMPFANFLALLPPLKLRHYSISSSPLMNPTTCSLTYSVIEGPSLSGLSARFQGVAGTHLQNLKPGDGVQVSVRSTNKFFRLPIEPEKTPITMFCAGTGLAPFRGFIEERAYLIKEGRRQLAPALLFIGCRAPFNDLLYADELREWASIGAVDVRYAFSREPESSEGCKYVQDRMLHDKKDVAAMWNNGAKFYICGTREVAKEIGRAARQLMMEKAAEQGKALTDEQLDAWVADKKNERFISDIFS
jgi:cytochrome P450 / NADPH-cytochrome P450 reductase